MKKNILITGAAGDIGKKIIEKYHKKFIIICVDKNLKKLNLIKKKYKSLQIYQSDLSNNKSLGLSLKKIIKKNKKIDILINNAGEI